MELGTCIITQFYGINQGKGGDGVYMSNYTNTSMYIWS